MKKIVMVIMASMLVMSLLAGCGGQKSADQKAPEILRQVVQLGFTILLVVQLLKY
ncbi:MAG: hypothetical protein H6Q71_2477 [Firmicutes bacterium]|nr:hypothetical protein [Bacillota bacterium]